MAYQLPPLTWLRAFEAAARHTSFTAASLELKLTQAAVSHQVRSLESHLGFPLFERLPRSLKLTDMGRAYLPSVRKAFDDLSASTAGLFGPMGERAIIVRAPISTAVLWLAPRLKSFRSAYPDIDVRLCSALWADALEGEEIDIDIRLGHGRWPGYEAEFIWNEGAVPVCAESTFSERGPVREVADFLAFERIHIIGYEDFWMRLFREADVTVPAGQQGLKMDTTLAAMETVSSGLGAAMVLRSFAHYGAATGRLVVPLEVELALEQSHYFLLPESGARPRPEVLVFRDWLFDEAKRI